jgi:GDP-4-dehydro-6-deoxy-D-mannose reductase
MAERFLITGVNGFVGRHLSRALLARGADVHGTAFAPGDDPLAGTGLEGVTVHSVDVRIQREVDAVVAAVQPDGVFHLAGVAFVPDAQANPTLAFDINAIGTIRVLAAVHYNCPAARVVSIGSSEVYGLIDERDLPVDESVALRPLSPYAASKAAADLAAFQWAEGIGVDVVRARPFNHTGPGQRTVFVCPDFATQLARIERGEVEPRIAVGDLDVVRDFSDVRDVVDGYIALLERGAKGEAYNICSGVGRTIRQVLDDLIELSGVEVEVTVDPAKLRPRRVPAFVGSAAKLQERTGWRPRRDWRDTLRGVLADCRQRAAIRRG